VAPLILIVVAGCVLSYVVQFLDMRICSFGQFAWAWGFPLALGISLALVPIISWYHCQTGKCSHSRRLIRSCYAESNGS